MSADITCGRAGGALISMQHCENCYYKRIPDDVSQIFCTYRIHTQIKEARDAAIEKSKAALHDMTLKRDGYYTRGRPRLAEKMEKQIKSQKEKHAELLKINEALNALAGRAIKAAEDHPKKRAEIIKKEEQLRAACKTKAAAEKLLQKENLFEL